MRRTRSVTLCVIYLQLAAVAVILSPARATVDGAVDSRVSSSAVVAAAATAAGPTKCRIDIKGDEQGGIRAASIVCAGAPATWTVSAPHLGTFQSSFQGVKVDPECGSAFKTLGCLIGICRSQGVLQLQAAIQGVRGVKNVLCIGGSSTVQLQSSLIADNTARGVLIVGSTETHVTFNASRVSGNRPGSEVWPGAGMLVLGNASVAVLDSSFAWNVGARAGGGVAVGNAGQVRFFNSCVCSNMVLGGVETGLGGGLYMANSAVVRLMQGSAVRGNWIVNGSGGGVALIDRTLLHLAGARVANNTCIDRSERFLAGGGISRIAKNDSGGGVFVTNSAVAIVSSASSIVGNRALNATGGGMAIFGNARVTVMGASRIMRNVAANYSGGGIIVGGQAQLSLGLGTLLAGNSATGIGEEGWAVGGGLAASGSASVALSDVLVIGNSAPWAGGLVASGNATVTISASKVSDNNGTASAGGGIAVAFNGSVTISDGSFVVDNSALSGGGGAVVMHNGSLTVSGGSLFGRNTAREGIGGALYASDNATVDIRQGVQFSGNKVAQFRAGQDIVVVDRVRLFMDGTVVGDSGAMTKCSTTVYLSTYICGAGESLTNGYCACCPVHTYSFATWHQNAPCEKCPEFAFCPGADIILPLAGYWHSSPQSVQIHQCPLLTKACGEHGKCQAGYQGNLCGACAAGYGMRQPLRCGQCMSPQRQMAVYLILSCLTVVFITLTVVLTWRDNQQPNVQLRPTDLIKALVQYLQYLVIFGSISAPFPDALNVVFEAASVVFGAASGQVLSLDCVLQHYVHASTPPLAIQRQLVNFLAPFLVLFLVILLLVLLSGARYLLGMLCARIRVRRNRAMPLRSSVKQLRVVRQWPMIAIVVVFYSYPTLVKASLSFFACLSIDDASGPYAEHAVRNHSAGYWVSDGLHQECFIGWHKAWALGLGLPAVLIFCVLLPLGLFCFLWFSKSRVAQTVFKEQYGFLYRNYADNRVWWEPVWMVQTVLLSAVSVFHFTIKAYYSVLLLGVMFVCSSVLQAVAKPYAHRKLHWLQLAASSCLFSTAYCTLALFTVYGYHASSAAAPVAVSAIMIILNCAFILWCLYSIVSAGVGLPAALAAAKKVALCCHAHNRH